MYDFFLFFTKEIVLIPFLLILYLMNQKTIATRTTLIVLFTIAFNSGLKSYFAIPLPESVNPNGYAFPSGHMQLAIAFWGWLMVEYRGRLFRLFGIGLLCGISGSLVLKGYHQWVDIWGSVGFGSVSLFLYYWLVFKEFKFERFLPLLSAVLTFISFLLIIFNHKTHGQHYLAMGALIGFTLGIYLTFKKDRWQVSLSWKQMVMNLLLGFVGVGFFVILFSGNIVPLSLHMRIFLEYFCIAFWVSYVVERFTVRR